MKLRRILSLTVAIAIVLSLFTMVLPAGAADEEIFVEYRETRDRTIYNIYSDEELMELFHVDYATLKRMSEEAYEAVMTNKAWDVSSYGIQCNTDALRALFNLISRNPECFFISNNFSYSYNGTSNKITKIVPKYAFSYDECMKMHAEFIAAAQEIICYFGRDESLTDLELALLVHDYIAANYEYYKVESEIWTDDWWGRYTAYGLLVKGSAVCQGYASAYAYLMKELGITCGYCSSTQLNHIWNIIEIDGVEYQVDITWDDPTNDRSGRTRHVNFLRSTDGMTAEGHTASDITGSTTDTKYDSAFWQDTNAPFCLLNGNIYYINGNGSLCTWNDGVTTELLTFNYTWDASATSGSPVSYSILATDGERLFLSTPKEILEYHPESNTTEVVYTYSTAPDPYWNIYGFNVKNNNFYIDVNSTPAFTTTTKLENQIVYPYRSGDIEDKHIYDNGTYTTVPTCITLGVKVYTCTVCGAKKEESVPTVGHRYLDYEIVENAHIVTCIDCGNSYREGHNFEGGVCGCGVVHPDYTGKCGNNLTWELNPITGLLRISGTGPMTDWVNESSVPWVNYRRYIQAVEIDSGVTSIGDYAFARCSNLTEVDIPDSVTSIGDHAFECSYVTEVVIPNSVTSIGDYAFADCNDLSDVTIGNGVVSIGEGAFFESYRLTKVTIPDSVKTIGNFAFMFCEGLTVVTIGKGVTSIGLNAFEYCYNLSRVNYTGTEKMWKEMAIEDGNDALFNAVIYYGPYYSGTCGANLTWELYGTTGRLCISGTGSMSNWTDANPAPWYPYKSYIRTVEIGSGVTSVGTCAFFKCYELTGATIPDSVTSIRDHAFVYCRNLTSVTIGNGVKSIGFYAFGFCSSLKKVHYKGTKEKWNEIAIESFNENLLNAEICFESYYSGNCGENLTWEFYTDTGLLRIFGTGAMTDWSSARSVPWNAYLSDILTVEIDFGVTSIGDYAFISCDKLTDVVISNSVTSIGNYAFEYCEGLTNVVIPCGVISIGEGAFADCYGLTDVTIGNGVTSIGNFAFQYCYDLTDLTIGIGVTSIGIGAFEDCFNLTDVHYKGTKEMWNEIAIEDCNEALLDAKIHYTEFNQSNTAPAHMAVIDPAVEATCTTDGLTEGAHCSACGIVLVEQETIPATGHSYSSQVTTAATCTNAGVKTFTCSKCANSYTEAIAATGHTEVVDKAVDATCTTAGKTEGSHCSVCNAIIKAQTTVAATGHSYTYKATKKPTTSATGTLTGTCSKCSGTTTVTLPKLNTADYTKTVTKEPTCTATGTDTYLWNTKTYGTFSFTATTPALGHNYTAVVTAPTCTARGYTTHTCTRCANSYKDSYTNATGHSYTSKVTTAATCANAGVKTFTCSKCSHSYTEAIAATGHTEVKDAAVAATCTTAGKTEGSHCSVCNAVIKAQTTIPATSHSYTSKVTTAATCTKAGVKTFTCSKCAHSYTEAIAATGHTEVVDKAVAATCTTAGKTEGSHCSVCNAVIKAQTTVPATGHSYTSKVTTAATCTKAGVKTFTCSKCNHSYNEAIAATGHTEVVDKAVAATCTAAGKTEGSHCSVCNAVIKAQTTIPATGHSYTSKVTTAATCTKNGVKTFTCSKCSHSYTEAIAATGHTEVVDKAVAATCTTAGKTEGSHCSVCNAVIKAQTTVPATGHSYTSKVTTAATCTKAGVKTFTCSKCNHSYTEAIAATGHTEVIDKAVAATCTTAGKTEGSHCSVCNAVIKAQTTVPATGHSYTSKVTTAATCTKNGVKTFTCSKCSHSYTEAIAATDHTVVIDAAVPATCTNSGLTEGKHCSVCNTVLVEQESVARLGHDYSKYTNNGDTHTATCSRCDKAQTSAHSYTNGTCICGAKEILPPILDESIKILHTLDLASDISVTFAVQKTALANYDSYYLECVLPEYNGNDLIGTSTVEVQPVVSGNYYYFTLTGITAVRMGDMVDAVLHMTKGGQEYYSKTDSYSVATYAYGMLNSSKDAKMLTLCADLLRYGAEAQAFKGYRTDALVDADMTEVHRSYLSNTETLTFTATDSYLGDLASPTITWVGKTLDLGSKVGMKFVFNAKNYSDDLSKLSMKVTYQGSTGETKSVTVTGIETYNANNKQYSFTFYGLLASELRTIVDVAIYEGNTQLSETLRYSAESYAAKTGTTALAGLTKALFAYSDSAKAFFAK